MARDEPGDVLPDGLPERNAARRCRRVRAEMSSYDNGSLRRSHGQPWSRGTSGSKIAEVDPVFNLLIHLPGDENGLRLVISLNHDAALARLDLLDQLGRLTAHLCDRGDCVNTFGFVHDLVLDGKENTMGFASIGCALSTKT